MNRPPFLSILLLFGLAALALPFARAELKLAPLLSEGAVLQRDIPVPVWGTATPGDRVTVTFAGQTKSATADAGGQWRVTLEPLPASGKPRSLSVASTIENRTSNVANLLVGEVWLASGQSNMAMRVDLARDPEIEKAAAGLPHLRVFTVPFVPSPEPRTDTEGTWVPSTPESAGKFSATAFFFGRELQRDLDIPVGLIVAAVGGSAIEAWTSAEAQRREPALEPLFQSWAEQDAAYTPAVEAGEKATYERAFAAWKMARSEAVKAGAAPPKAPRRPFNPRLHHHHPAVLFNGMIAPLIPYAIRGAIWYQGETNAFTEESSALYELQLPLLVDDWRARWGQGDFHFAWVQLPFASAESVAWARIRESMRRASALPNTGMAVTLDLGEERLLHPRNKQAFAHRLALWARADVYGEDLPWSGPQLLGHRAGEKGVLLHFDHAEGLGAAEDPLVGFELLTAGGEWQPGIATVQDDNIVVSAPGLTNPVAARYAWANHPEGNLTNATGLPASPFTTEDSANPPDKTPKTAATDAARATKKSKPVPEDLVPTPFVPADFATFPGQTDHLDIFLLIGQSNMKGRGVMPAKPLQDPQILMLHKRTDEWFHARHPLHHVGDPVTFENSDNAGVGPGLAFATTLAKKQPTTRIALLPCAVGGTSLAKWQKGERLYDETIRRAQLALAQGPKGKTRIAGALWLQGEADSGTPERIAAYPAGIARLIADLRADTGVPDLPFIACTIGELRADSREARAAINAILLDLPDKIPNTACVDSRAFAADIGDSVHFDTPTQNKHGELFATKYLELTK